MLSLLVQVIEANGPSCVRVHPIDWMSVEAELIGGGALGVYEVTEGESLAGMAARVLGVPVVLDAQVNRGCVAWETT